jgi:hypothetical protein
VAPPSPPQEDAIARIDGAPLVLLPVRLETRYIGDPANPTELRIRVYPEQVHIDAHEPRLTAGEVRAGKTYWRSRWVPLPGVDDAAGLAWADLARGVGAPRAAWIIKATKPLNPLGDPAGPTFPSVGTRPPGSDVPMNVRAMPTQWVTLGYDANGHEVLRRWFDKPVPAKLRATATLTSGADLEGDDAVDAYLTWAADYDLAVSVGMAVTIKPEDLTNGVTLAGGFARLVVCGVDVKAGSVTGAARLSALLSAHAYSDGLAYLRPGTPTNNTADAPAAGGPPADNDPAVPTPALDTEHSAGSRMQRFLGLVPDAATGDPPITSTLPGAADTTARVMSDLVQATWLGSIGYFADQLLFPVVTPSTLSSLRDHAARFLQPLGPLPTLRIGRQPLALLPVMTPEAVASDERIVNTLADGIRKLRPIWELAVPRVPRLIDDAAPAGDDVERLLATILQRGPWTTRIWYRRVFGPLVGLATGSLGNAQRLQAVLRTIGFLDALQVDAQPRVVGLGLHDRTEHLRIPFLGPGEDTEPPTLDYLATIRAMTMQDGGRNDLSDGARPTSLLYALAAFAGVQEIDAAAARIGARFWPRETAGRAFRTPEISGIGSITDPNPRELVMTPRRELGGRTLAQEVVLRQRTTPGDRNLGDLKTYQQALARLAAADPRDVDPAFRSYLGACSHRMDAWITSLATRRLESLRSSMPIGAHIGGYGYVEDLVPEQAPDSLGYLLAPSIAHAATAGVLRSGYLAQRATGAENLDIDLSSARTQTALQLMRGVRAGGSLSALLGYRLERSLRDHDLSVFILPVRKAFPLSTPASTPAQPTESIPPNNVADAADLLDRWLAGASGRNQVLALVRAQAGVPAGDPRLDALATHIDNLADVYDAVADLVLTESVHQLLRGQPERAQAASAFLDRQEVPVEPEVAATPRTSWGFVQRCVVVLGSTTASTDWQPHTAGDPRAEAEPRVNTWISQLLGDPEQWSFVGEAVNASGEVQGPPAIAHLGELGLSPLRAVLAATTGSGRSPTELEQRLHRLMDARLTVPPRGSIRLRTDPSNELGLGEFLALAGAIQRALANMRPGDARLFDVPDGTAPPGLNTADLERRADAAETRLRAAATALTRAVDTNRTQQRLIAALDRVSAAGLPAAVPDTEILTPDDSRPAGPALLEFAGDLLTQTKARLAALDQLTQTPPTSRDADFHTARLTAVFGAAFPVLGVFSLAANAPIRRCLEPANQAALRGGDDLATTTWMTRLARVRPAIDALWHLVTAAEVTSDYDVDSFAVLQAPHRDGQRWAALQVDATASEQPRPRVALTIHTPGRSTVPVTMAAMAVDSWTEQLPSAQETAGLAFHFDAPSTRAPQSALLAVPSGASPTPWTLRLIADSILEAFDLARIRGATLQDLPAIGAVLPALYLPLDASGNVPSVDVDRLAQTLGPDQLTLGRD